MTPDRESWMYLKSSEDGAIVVVYIITERGAMKTFYALPQMFLFYEVGDIPWANSFLGFHG
jgi:hypothetical protein